MKKNLKSIWIILGIIIILGLIFIIVYKNRVKNNEEIKTYEMKIEEKLENENNINNKVTTIDIEKVFQSDEISENGVDEKLLFENIDINILETIANELQTLVTEEMEQERENPEIVITEGWTRVFKSERYKKILNIGKPAMKPLYLIIYKSPNAGMYEYICANALYELSGFNFEWANSKEFLKKFNEKIIEERH